MHVSVGEAIDDKVVSTLFLHRLSLKHDFTVGRVLVGQLDLLRGSDNGVAARWVIQFP